MNDLKEKIFKYAEEYYEQNFKNKSKKENNYIPATGKLLDKDDLTNLIDASLDMWLTAGRYAAEFENNLSEYLGVKYCSLVNSGSSANLLAVTALTSHKLGDKRLKPKDEVITVAAGFPTTITPIIQNNLIPVFVDIELGTYNIDVSNLEDAISEKTKAIFLAHTLGNPFNLEIVLQVCRKYGLWLIEDNCDALGSKYKDKYTGTFGDISTFSFYPAHHITMGEGGAVITNDHQLNNIIVSLRDWGRDCSCSPGEDNRCGKRFSQQHGNLPFGYDHKYVYSHLGYNLKLTDIQAAIGVSQLKKLPEFTKKRRENYNQLFDNLKKYDEYFILPKEDELAVASWFNFPLTVREEAPFTRNEIIQFLEKNNIGTRLLFAGNMLRQPAFVENNIDYKVISELKNTDIAMNNTFSIGLFPAIGKEEIEYMIKIIDQFVGVI